MTERLIRRALARWHFDATPQAATEGNLYRPVEIAEGAVHGDRRPQIGFPGFALWAIGELGRMALQSIGRGLRSLLPKRAALPARTAWSRS